MNPILEYLKEKEKSQKANLRRGESIKNISYYGGIKLIESYEKSQYEITEDLYLVEKEVNGKKICEFYVNGGIIATADPNGIIKISPKFEKYINKEQFLNKVKGIIPLSLKELEEQENSEKTQNELEEEKESNKELKKEELKEESKEELKKVDKNLEKQQEDTKEQTNEEKYHLGPNDAIIDMNKKITETKTFRYLVPETVSKNIQKVIVRRITGDQFTIVGINNKGEEVKFQSLIQTEGILPKKKVVKIDGVGAVVEKEQVTTMLKIRTGENQGKEDEGFTIKLGQYGIPEVSYYRRAKEDNEYTSIPVNLENTNQKRTDLDVREYMEKRRNISVEDNIRIANERIGEERTTKLENIDDNPYNDVEDEYEIAIKKAANRCKVSIESFKKEMEKIDNGTMEQKIEKAEESINEQFRGNNQRR